MFWHLAVTPSLNGSKASYIKPNILKTCPLDREEYAESKDVQEDGGVTQARLQLGHIKNVAQKLSGEPLLIVLISIISHS